MITKKLFSTKSYSVDIVNKKHLDLIRDPVFNKGKVKLRRPCVFKRGKRQIGTERAIGVSIVCNLLYFRILKPKSN